MPKVYPRSAPAHRATLTSKGQLTIPKAVRERLSLQAGDQLVFRFEDDGSLELEVLRPDRRVDRLRGILKDYAPARPVSVEEMREAVLDRAVEDQRKSTQGLREGK